MIQLTTPHSPHFSLVSLALAPSRIHPRLPWRWLEQLDKAIEISRGCREVSPRHARASSKWVWAATFHAK